MHVTKNMYLDEVYKLYLEHFAKFCILAKINATNHDFHGIFMVFTMKLGNLHYYICNQHVEICKYGEFEENRRIHPFGTAPQFRKIRKFSYFLVH